MPPGSHTQRLNFFVIFKKYLFFIYLINNNIASLFYFVKEPKELVNLMSRSLFTNTNTPDVIDTSVYL